MKYRALHGLVLSGLLGLGCTINVPLDGKRCPCVGGFVCDGLSQTCVPNDAPIDDGKIRVSNLRAEWATPNSIGWRWDVEGAQSDFLSYQLVTGETEGDVITQSESARVWTVELNPELGRFMVPRTDGEELVVATITDGHDPRTTYYGLLIATDSSGNRWRAGLAGKSTADPWLDERVLFHDDPPPAAFPPGVFIHTTEGCYESSAGCFVAPIECPGRNACRLNTAIQELGVSGNDLASITDGKFINAYVEFAVASDSEAVPYWSTASIRQEAGAPIWFYEPFTIRPDGSYRLMQIPLSRLRSFDTPEVYLDRAQLVAQGIYEFGAGGNWSDGSHVWIDEVRLKW